MHSVRSLTAAVLRPGPNDESRERTRVRADVPVALLALGAILAAASPAAVIDRIAVIVGNTVITQSEVLREVRLTEFLNRQPLDLGPRQRRAAAERLVDQQLIREEMSNGTYEMPEDAEAGRMLDEFHRESFATAEEYRAALARYGITEDELRRHLYWELAALRFTDVRFQPNAPTPSEQSANRVQPGAPMPPPKDVEQRLDAWLKETRASIRVVFKAGAFQ